MEGVLFDRTRTTLIQYPGGNTRSSYRVPDSVTSISRDAFAGCTWLTCVTIPANIKYIDYYAFDGCTGLTRFYFDGDAPNRNSFGFILGAIPATVYYLQGTKGWTRTFGGRPTEPWSARIVAEDGQLGQTEGRFGFTLAGVAGSTVLVEASEEDRLRAVSDFLRTSADKADWADRGLQRRSAEAEGVRVIVREEVERFGLEATARQAAPLVAQLYDKADAVRHGERRFVRRYRRSAVTRIRE